MRLPVNTILLADAYKFTHWLQIPKGTEYIEAYGEARGTEIPEIQYTKFFGVQGFLLDYLEGEVIQQWMIEEAETILGETFSESSYFNKAGFQLIVDKYNGRLPIKIFAAKEGIRIPHQNVCIKVCSADKDLAWVAPWVETMLLRAKWYPTAVCTISCYVMDLQKKWAAICGAKISPFFLNDFGARGVSSHESAEIGGAANLVNTLGTDTVEAIRWAKHRYPGATGASVLASEHGSTTIYTREGEVTAYKNILQATPKNKIASLVVDSYSTKNAVINILGNQLKQLILEREAPTVFRPDSGDPLEMSLNVIIWLGESFGYTLNDKGFKVLNPKVRVIYGDGINIRSIDAICENLVMHGWSIENIVFGMGGKLLQGVTRDTFKDAFKTCYAIINGNPVDIYKDPDTDNGKKSKRGPQKLIKINGEYKTCRTDEYLEHPDLLELVFDCGKVCRIQTMDEVRANDLA